MKAKTKFIKMYFKLEKEAREVLVYNYWSDCLSLNVCYHEVKNDTDLGKRILRDLGYED